MNGERKLPLEEVTCSSFRVHDRLEQYIDRLMLYDNFNEAQHVRVYVDGAGDFIAFEGVEHRIQFVSNDKKLTEFLNTPYLPIVCSFRDWKNHIKRLSA